MFEIFELSAGIFIVPVLGACMFVVFELRAGIFVVASWVFELSAGIFVVNELSAFISRSSN